MSFTKNVKEWKKYKAVSSAGFRTGIAYRLHYFVSVFAVPFYIIIYYYLWNAIFSYSAVEVINGYTLEGMVTYYVIAMIVGFITWTDVDEWIERDVIQGSMINPLMKPLSYFSWHVYFTIGLNWLGIFIEFLPVIILGAVFGLTLVSGWYILLFILGIGIAASLNFLIAYLVGLSAFWLQRISGLRRVRRVLVAFLSGSMIPLTFFPSSVQRVFDCLPFTSIRFIPIQLYLEQLSITTGILALAKGLVWILLLYLAGRLMWTKAFKKFTGAGI